MAPDIQRLPEHVINQVCAGEVIERPGAVVKELVENSLDAGASHVAVVFRRAGKDFISVADDGIAMGPDDAVICLERHATSKIRSTEDLSKIGTFGFRGEAIPAIASVSKFTLRTRRDGDELGTEIVVDDGNICKVGKCVCPKGTCIEVAQLFKSVPARRKFLKSDQTEANHIIDTVRLFALDFPRIRFSIRHEDRTIWDVHAETSAEERIGKFWGSEIWASLVAVDFAENGCHVHGWVLDPQKRSGGGDMVFFVNRRVIVSKELKNWVMGAYAKYLPYAKSVPCFLFLNLPPDQVDVNVHPAKREVRFSHGAELKALISQAIGNVLGRGNSWPMTRSEVPWVGLNLEKISPVPQPDEDASKRNPQVIKPTILSGQSQEDSVVAQDEAVMSASAPPSGRGKTAPGKKISPTRAESPAIEGGNQPKFIKNFPPIGNFRLETPVPLLSKSRGIIDWKFLGKMDERCVLFATEAGLIFFDVLRAAQRVAYERILAQQGEAGGQRLLIPLTLDLRRQSFEVTEEMVGELARIGFGLQKKAYLLYEITTLPQWMRECSGEAFLYDWLVLKRANLHGMQMELLAKTAAGYVASSKKWQTEHEIMQLVGDLMACEIAVLALDGARIYFEISRSEIERRWKGA
ncbi:MAG: DNA mismatch repair endonuclease MutL [Puniceicoccales bacterium]|jgi:DNA mismatch repair protein MutL|nr:DNA mismatch repair endonuclease MutL [Puniceicoccales bacterium]